MRPQPPVLIAAALSCLATAAAAHPRVRAQIPAAGAVLTSSPAQIRITFNEPLVAAFSGLALKDQAGKSVTIGKAALDPKDPKQLAAPVKTTLGPGTYTVLWRAVAADTHHVAGQFSFRVKP